MPMNNRLMRPAKGSAGPGAETLLLLHFDSASTTGLITDSSQYNRQLVSYQGTPYEDASYDIYPAPGLAVSGVGSKFGANAINLQGPFGVPLDGLANRNILPDLSQEDHTIECWVYYPSEEAAMITATIAHFPVTQDLTSTSGQHLYISGDHAYFNDGTAPSAETASYEAEPTALPYGQWFHLAAVQQGTCKRIFINGQLKAVATQAAPAGACSLSIGAFAYNTQGDPPIRLYYLPQYPIYIDELRILYGVAAYSANFTPPSAPLSSPPPAAPSIACCRPAGLILATYCSGIDLYADISDGTCGDVSTMIAPGNCA